MLGPDRAVRIPPANRNDPIEMGLHSRVSADPVSSPPTSSVQGFVARYVGFLGSHRPVRLPRLGGCFRGHGLVQICDCSIPVGWVDELEYNITWILERLMWTIVPGWTLFVKEVIVGRFGSFVSLSYALVCSRRPGGILARNPEPGIGRAKVGAFGWKSSLGAQRSDRKRNIESSMESVNQPVFSAWLFRHIIAASDGNIIPRLAHRDTCVRWNIPWNGFTPATMR